MSNAVITAAPFLVGDRVILDRPESRQHPRAGRTGTVIRVRYYPEVAGRGRVLWTAVWMVRIRFDPPAVPDGFDRLGVGAEWTVYESELSHVR